jgi:hypothetical protein
MPTANTNDIVDIKSLRWSCSRSAELSRHIRFPRPEATAVVMATVLARAHKDAVITMAPSNEWR